MSERKRLFALIFIMAACSAVVGTSTMFILYHAAFERQRERLVDTVRGQTWLMRGMAHLDDSGEEGASVQPRGQSEWLKKACVECHEDFHRNPAGASPHWPSASDPNKKGEPGSIPHDTNALLSLVTEANRRYAGFGETGEFSLAQRRGDQMVFLMTRRRTDVKVPGCVPMNGILDEPMRRALRGESGTLVGLDYRGETVLAAHEPLGMLNLGIVAKIDVAEIRAPFVKAGLLAGGLGLVVVILGAVLFVRVTNPMIRRLEESVGNLRTILETAADGIVMIRESGEIEDFNPAAGVLFGYGVPELLGRKIGAVVPFALGDGGGGDFVRYLETKVRGGVGAGRRVTGQRKDGTTFPMSICLGEMVVGGERRYVGIVHDLTEVEAARRQAAEQEKLISLGMMAAGVAHEVGNPLNSIMAVSQGMRRGAGDPELKKNLEMISREVKRASKTLRQITQLARPTPEEMAQVQIDEVARTLVELLRHDSRARGNRIEIRVEGEIPPIMGYRDRLTQVFFNLLINALDALSGQGGVVTLRCGRSEGNLVVDVEDTGCGIPRAHLPELFRPFFTTKAPGRGTGLGLWISRDIVEQHGGSVRIRSEANEGTIATVTLPVHGWPSRDLPAAREREPELAL